MATPAKKPAKKATTAASKPTKAAAKKAEPVKKPTTAKAAKVAPIKAVKAAPAKPAVAKAGAPGAGKPAATAKAVPATAKAATAAAKPAAAGAKAAPAAKPAAPAAKAVPAKAVPPKPVPPKPKKSPFTPKELEAARQALMQQRAFLAQEADDLSAGTFDTSQSELSGEVAFDEEYADAGTFTFERERDLSLGNNIRDLMDKIDTALQKIARGTYGVCERCGEQIPKERMQALPYSVLCVRDKQIEERQR